MSSGRAAGALGSLMAPPAEPKQMDVEDVAGKPVQPIPRDVQIAAARRVAAAPRERPEKPRAGGRKVGKSKDPGYHKLTVYIPQKTRQKVAVKIAKDGSGLELSDLVAELLDGWTAGLSDA